MKVVPFALYQFDSRSARCFPTYPVIPHVAMEKTFWIQDMVNSSINCYNLLVVWNIFYEFPYIGNNHPNWLSYFSEGLKPPTSYVYAYILSEMGNSFSPVSLSGIQLYIPMYWLVSSFFMAGKLPTSSHPKTSVVWWIANAINHGKKGLLGIVYGIGFTTSINGLVDGKIYRKPWFLPWNIGLSCRFSLKPIQWLHQWMIS